MAILGVAAFLAWRGAHEPSAPPASDIGGSFHLTAQNGARVDQSLLNGKWTAVYFGYTFCPDVCPTTLGVMAQALEKLGADSQRVVPVFITIDPARDTPKVLADYMKAFGPSFVGLTGSDAQIKAVEKEYRVYAAKRPLDKGGYGMDHSSVLYLMGPNGKMVSFYDEAVSPDDLAKDLKQKI